MDLEIIFMKMGITILVHMLEANDKVSEKNKLWVVIFTWVNTLMTRLKGGV